MYQPVNRRDDEGDRGEADGGGRPFAHGQRQLGALPQQVQRRSAHAVNGEARDYHRGEGLPHKRVHDSDCYTGRLPWVFPVGLEGQMEDQEMRVETESQRVDTQNNVTTL